MEKGLSMTLELIKLEVGPWPMNCYILVCPETQISAIVDPGANPEKILRSAKGTNVASILLTHAHPDHVGALQSVRHATKAPIYIHPADAAEFQIDFDISLADGDAIQIGNSSLKVIYSPGHTPGQCCFDLGDNRVIVGDTIFVGGPGRTWSSPEFEQTMQNMQNIVFQWADETTFFPGHGPNGIIGEERPAFENFIARGWDKDLYGDVTWQT